MGLFSWLFPVGKNKKNSVYENKHHIEVKGKLNKGNIDRKIFKNETLKQSASGKLEEVKKGEIVMGDVFDKSGPILSNGLYQKYENKPIGFLDLDEKYIKILKGANINHVLDLRNYRNYFLKAEWISSNIVIIKNINGYSKNINGLKKEGITKICNLIRSLGIYTQPTNIDEEINVNISKKENILSKRTSHIKGGKKTYKNSGKIWTQKEDELLKHLFKDEKYSLSLLSKRFGRNIPGIVARLTKLGLFYDGNRIKESEELKINGEVSKKEKRKGKIGEIGKTKLRDYNIDNQNYKKWYGFDENGINKNTGTQWDENGFDIDGINIDTGTKYSIYHFDRDGINEYTDTKYDEDGYDVDGYDMNGFDREGINRNGQTKEQYKNFIKQEQYNNRKFDEYGFDGNGIHKITGTQWDENGFDANGINIDTGTVYSIYHFDRDGINEYTGTKFDEDGYDVDGYDIDGFDRSGDKRLDSDVEQSNGLQPQDFHEEGLFESNKDNDSCHEDLRGDIIDKLKSELNFDIYSVKYTESVLLKYNIGRKKYNEVLSLLGYSVKKGCIVKKKYKNFVQYMKYQIKNKDIIRIDKDIVNTNPNYNVMADFCRKYELFKVNEGIYISWIKMADNGIDFKYLNIFFENLNNHFGEKSFFSIKNVVDEIDVDGFKKLGLDDTFIENIIFYGKGISTLRINNNRLFSYVLDKPTRNDFIKSEMKKYKSISLSKFVDVVNRIYGLDLDYDIVKYYTYGLSDIYYNPTMDKLYQTKQDFYNEIYNDE